MKKPSRNEGFSRLCTPNTIRTCDPQLRRLLLYPTELPGQTLLIIIIKYYEIARKINLHKLINIITFPNWKMY